MEAEDVVQFVNATEVIRPYFRTLLAVMLWKPPAVDSGRLGAVERAYDMADDFMEQLQIDLDAVAMQATAAETPE